MAAPHNKHSVTIAGHRTSISLEPPFWTALHALARREGLAVAALIGKIDRERAGGADAGQRAERLSLSAAIRLYVLKHGRDAGT